MDQTIPRLFGEGDVVSHVAGGPLMTVENIRSDELIATLWFDAAGLHRDAFAGTALQRWVKVG